MRRVRDDRGAAAVEFGIVVVILLTLLIGIIQFSIWFWAYQVGAHAAREGARVGAVNPCAPASAATIAKDRIGNAADGPKSAVVTPPPSPVKVGDQITVTVSYKAFHVGGFLPALPTITKSATSRIENVPAGGC